MALSVNTTESKESHKFKPRYPIPEIQSVLPYNENPLHLVEPMDSQCKDWCFETSLFSRDEFRRIANATYYTAYFYSFCTDRDRYETLTKSLVNVFILDDHMETTWGEINRKEIKAKEIYGQLHEVCDKLLDPGNKSIKMDRWKPYILGAYAIYGMVVSAYNDCQRKRCLMLLKGWADGMIEECIDLNADKRIDNLTQFMEVRDRSVAVRFFIQLMEYADNLFVPQAEWDHPKFQRLLELATYLVTLVNEVYSFEKEVKERDWNMAEAYNMVAFYVRFKGMSVTEAMDSLVKDYMEMESEIVALKEEVLTEDWLSPDTRVFVGRIMYFIGGALRAHVLMKRYSSLMYIPKNTRVVLHQYCILMDKAHWDNPDQFNPQRFLDNHGKYVSSKPVAYIPFTYGRRICSGETLTINDLLVALVRFMQLTNNYKIEFSGDRDDSDSALEPDPSNLWVQFPKQFQIVLKAK